MSKLPQKNQISETNVFEGVWIEVSTLVATSMTMTMTIRQWLNQWQLLTPIWSRANRGWKSTLKK